MTRDKTTDQTGEGRQCDGHDAAGHVSAPRTIRGAALRETSKFGGKGHPQEQDATSHVGIPRCQCCRVICLRFRILLIAADRLPSRMANSEQKKYGSRERERNSKAIEDRVCRHNGWPYGSRTAAPTVRNSSRRYPSSGVSIPTMASSPPAASMRSDFTAIVPERGGRACCARGCLGDVLRGHAENVRAVLSIRRWSRRGTLPRWRYARMHARTWPAAFSRHS